MGFKRYLNIFHRHPLYQKSYNRLNTNFFYVILLLTFFGNSELVLMFSDQPLIQFLYTLFGRIYVKFSVKWKTYGLGVFIDFYVSSNSFCTINEETRSDDYYESSCLIPKGIYWWNANISFCSYSLFKSLCAFSDIFFASKHKLPY